MAVLPHPPHVLGELRDKYQHMIAFATLTALGVVAFPTLSRWRLLERLSFLGAVIEVFQSIPALHRDCDPLDWLADTLAVALVLIAFRLIERQPN